MPRQKVHLVAAWIQYGVYDDLQPHHLDSTAKCESAKYPCVQAAYYSAKSNNANDGAIDD